MSGATGGSERTRPRTSVRGPDVPARSERSHHGGFTPLAGLRVVDATEGVAGRYASKLLADLGGEVTKIEREGGDPLRRWSAATPDADVPDPAAEPGALFAFLHERHTSVPAGDAAATDALRSADVVLAGPAGGALVGSGTGQPELVPPADACVVTVEAFGRDGPLAGRRASEFSLQAWCGLMSGCGTPDTPPLQMGARHGLFATGATAAFAAVVAHEHRTRTGVAAQIEVSALEVMAVCLLNYPTLYRRLVGANVMSRSGDWLQIVRCKDGWIGLCLFTPQQWDDFAHMIGHPDLAGDPRLNSMRGRGQHRALAESLIRPWLEQHTAEEIFELGGLFRVPVAYVGNGRDVFTMEHFAARGVFVANRRGFLQPRSPFRGHATSLETRGAEPPGPAAPEDARPLDGVRVVDFTAFWAGPAATHLLAAVGADVVKIESPTRPDGMRFATTRAPDDPQWMEFSPTFHAANPGKRSVAIDFSSTAGRDLVLRLVEHADVVVENFTPRVMPNVGLDYEVLAVRRPGLVMVRMPAFGLDGPWRDHSGFAQTAEQVSGIAWLTGTRAIDPVVRSTVDPIAGIHGALAVAAALVQRRRSGLGQLVEVPMVEVALNVVAEPIVTWSASGTLLERDGNRGPHGAPQGVYRCRGEEQWLALSIGDDDAWESLRRAIGDPEWARDVALATRAGRRAHHDVVDDELAAWCAGRDRDATVAALVAAGVDAAPVWDQNTLDELPQLRERRFWQVVHHTVAGELALPGIGLRSPQFATSYRSPAPTVGQHTEDVLAGILGLGREELEELEALASDAVVGRTDAARAAPP